MELEDDDFLRTGYPINTSLCVTSGNINGKVVTTNAPPRIDNTSIQQIDRDNEPKNTYLSLIRNSRYYKTNKSILKMLPGVSNSEIETETIFYFILNQHLTEDFKNEETEEMENKDGKIKFNFIDFFDGMDTVSKCINAARLLHIFKKFNKLKGFEFSAKWLDTINQSLSIEYL